MEDYEGFEPYGFGLRSAPVGPNPRSPGSRGPLKVHYIKAILANRVAFLKDWQSPASAKCYTKHLRAISEVLFLVYGELELRIFCKKYERKVSRLKKR